MALNKNPFSGLPLAPMALGFFLVPLTGMKSGRRRLRRMPHLMGTLMVIVLSLGTVLGLSGCGEKSTVGPAEKSYTVVVTATDGTTGARSSANVTLNVQ
jgi:hypothetical protein